MLTYRIEGDRLVLGAPASHRSRAKVSAERCVRAAITSRRMRAHGRAELLVRRKWLRTIPTKPMQ